MCIDRCMESVLIKEEMLVSSAGLGGPGGPVGGGGPKTFVSAAAGGASGSGAAAAGRRGEAAEAAERRARVSVEVRAVRLRRRLRLGESLGSFLSAVGPVRFRSRLG
jgi:hypothetical protein